MSRTRRWPVFTLASTVLGLHVALVLYFAPPRVMFSPVPVVTHDHALSYYQANRARASFDRWGKLWAYDPQKLAGQPTHGLCEGASIGFFSIALGKLGLTAERSYNLFLLAIHLLVPFIGFLAARLFRLDTVASLVAALLWVLLWFFDSFLHWSWFAGAPSFSFACCLAVLLLAITYRAQEDRRAMLWLVAAAAAALVTLSHPLAHLVWIPPALALYVRRVRRLGLAHGLGLLLTLAAAGSGALAYWPFASCVPHQAEYLRPGISFLLTDFLDLTQEPWNTGGGSVRTVFRFLCLGAAAYLFQRWWRERDRRLLPLGMVVGLTLSWAYLGGYVPVLARHRPYQLVVPAALAAALPAAAALCELISATTLRGLGQTARLLLIFAALLLLPRVGVTVLRFLPTTGVIRPAPPLQAHTGVERPEAAVADWLRANHQGRGRVLVQDPALAEHLVRSTSIPVIGGSSELALPHLDALLFHFRPDGKLPGPALREYFERYAVGFVVVRNIKMALEWRKDELRFRVLIGGIRIYETRIAPSYFARGEGQVLFQGLNSIQVRMRQPQDPLAQREAVLRFHWLKTLRCRPGCRVERFSTPGDRVGFIRVVDPPPDFEIYNAYRP